MDKPPPTVSQIQDVICGFPAEGAEDHQLSMDLVKEYLDEYQGGLSQHHGFLFEQQEVEISILGHGIEVGYKKYPFTEGENNADR